MTKQYNWGIIGTGGIAATFADALKELPNGKAYAVCSRSEENAKAFTDRFNIDVMYASIDELSTDEKVDIIYIATPHSAHYEAARTAILAGKNVLCEKPITLSLPQAEDLIRLAREHNVFLMEAVCTSFSPGYKKAKEWIEKGLIGKIKRISAGFHLPKAASDNVARLHDINLGGGALLDVGMYPIYYANSFLEGDPEIVYTHAEKDAGGVDRENTALLKYGDAEVHITSGFNYEDNHAEIVGESGFVSIPFASSPSAAYLFEYSKQRDSFHEPVENHLKAEIAHVMECLSKGLTESPKHPFDMTLRGMKLCDRLRNEWGIRYPNEGVARSIQSFNHIPKITGENLPDWYKDAVFYHIYPLGMCGVPLDNDFTSEPVNRIKIVGDITSHLNRIGVNALYIGPLFESSRHGYDTAGYRVIDRRLGTNQDFADVCETLHNHGIKVILDGVFNHVGRDFWAFNDVKTNRQNSPYCGWFNINFGGNSNYNDGFFYEGWEGHYDLVKLNLNNDEVKRHIFESIREWYEKFNIDGLRLDVAYCLNEQFLRELHAFCKNLSPNFFLLGEMVHGDYNRIMNDQMCDSATNYQCYKGMYSAINCKNMHEIAYSFKQQSGGEHWSLYQGKNMYNFLENHDVSRIATILSNPKDLLLAYALMFSAPGIPSIYYGGEFGIKGDKKNGDNDLRPSLTYSNFSESFELTDYIINLSAVYHSETSLRRGDYAELHVGSETLAFSRSFEKEKVIFAMNVGDGPAVFHELKGTAAVDLITGQSLNFQGSALTLPAKTACILRLNN